MDKLKPLRVLGEAVFDHEYSLADLLRFALVADLRCPDDLGRCFRVRQRRVDSPCFT
jgi:hypothetical protein